MPFEDRRLARAHERLLQSVPPYRGERWLDVATGTGAIACAAAARGAQVTCLDTDAGLVEAARRRAGAAEVEVFFELGDLERLPCGDAAFDTVSSGFGVSFAPDAEAAASELARVTKPGGRLGLLSWSATPAGGELFEALAAERAPRSEAAGDPLGWGDRDNLERLLGEAFDLSYEDAEDHLLVAGRRR